MSFRRDYYRTKHNGHKNREKRTFLAVKTRSFAKDENALMSKQ